MKRRTLAGRRVWLVGASSGIGLELARRFADGGAQVFASARRAEPLQALAQENHRIIPLPLDVTDAAACQTASGAIAAYAGSLDTLVVNAGQCEYVDVASLDPGSFRRMMDVNFLGALNVVAAGLPLLRKAEADACLLAVGSLATRLPFTRAAAYGASKAALEYCLDALAVDLAPESIEVITVSPGFVATRLTAQNDFAMPMQVTAAAAAEAIIDGFCRRQRRIAFPRAFALFLNLLSKLPAAGRVAIARQLADRSA